MKLHEQRQTRMNLVGRYAPGEVQINGRSLVAPLVVAPGLPAGQWIARHPSWHPTSLAPVWSTATTHRAAGKRGAPDGTPESPAGPCVQSSQVALEVMDLGAACRTYNVLAQEDRAVVALLFP